MKDDRRAERWIAGYGAAASIVKLGIICVMARGGCSGIGSMDINTDLAGTTETSTTSITTLYPALKHIAHITAQVADEAAFKLLNFSSEAPVPTPVAGLDGQRAKWLRIGAKALTEPHNAIEARDRSVSMARGPIKAMALPTGPNVIDEIQPIAITIAAWASEDRRGNAYVRAEQNLSTACEAKAAPWR